MKEVREYKKQKVDIGITYKTPKVANVTYNIICTLYMSSSIQKGISNVAERTTIILREASLTGKREHRKMSHKARHTRN